jgi:hypothetical protein
VDIEVILDAVETEAPGLRALARRFPEAEAGRLGAPPDVGAVLARRAGSEPEVHITAAAGEPSTGIHAGAVRRISGNCCAVERAGCGPLMDRARGGNDLQIRRDQLGFSGFLTCADFQDIASFRLSYPPFLRFLIGRSIGSLRLML